MNFTDIGVNQVAERIHGRLQRYLEAQYHIRDSGFIEERRLLLLEPGSISQRPSRLMRRRTHPDVSAA